MSERLKNREVYADKHSKPDDLRAERARACGMLDDAVNRLVQKMNAIERDGVLSREEVENCVLFCLEWYEKKLYAMSDDDFDFYVDLHNVQMDLRGKGRR